MADSKTVQDKNNHNVNLINGNKSLDEKFSINVIAFTESFYSTVKYLFDRKELTDVDPELINIASGIIKSVDDKSLLIKKYIEYSHDKWSLIKKRDRDFLINHAKTLFANIPGNAAEIFTKLFTSTKKNASGVDEYVINKTYENSYWQYFESFTKLCIKYIHEQRKPGTVGQYSNPGFFANVDIKSYAELFNVKLEWK